jgi:hypothetical protein
VRPPSDDTRALFCPASNPLSLWSWWFTSASIHAAPPAPAPQSSPPAAQRFAPAPGPCCAWNAAAAAAAARDSNLHPSPPPPPRPPLELSSDDLVCKPWWAAGSSAGDKKEKDGSPLVPLAPTSPPLPHSTWRLLCGQRPWASAEWGAGSAFLLRRRSESESGGSCARDIVQTQKCQHGHRRIPNGSGTSDEEEEEEEGGEKGGVSGAQFV